MKKIILFILLFVSFYCYSNIGDTVSPISQKDTTKNTKLKKNSIYLEGAGNGFYYSINYDRIIFHYNKSSFLIRGGFGFILVPPFNDIYLSTLISFNGLYRLKKHLYLEYGLGLTYMYESNYEEYYDNMVSDQRLLPNITLGIRVSIFKKTLIRLDFVSFYYKEPPFKSIVPFGGISLGWNF